MAARVQFPMTSPTPSQVESQPLAPTDKAAQKVVQKTLLDLVQEGFIPSAIASYTLGTVVTIANIANTGISVFLPAIPSFVFGGGTGGAVTRVAYSILKKTDAPWTKACLSLFGGALFGANLGIGASIALAPSGNLIVITSSSAAISSALFGISSYLDDSIVSVSLGSGIGSLVATSISGLGWLLGSDSAPIFTSALTAGITAGFGFLNSSDEKPLDENPNKTEGA